MRIFMVVVLISSLLVGCEPMDTTDSEILIDIGEHKLQMRPTGKGAPVVVFEAGIADPMDRLFAFHDRIARETRVISYNRAGYGASEAGPLPRSAVREAEELKLLLDRASVPPPYVLVGHSLGAFVVQMFAANYPDDVSGIVLLDPPPLAFALGKEFTDLAAMAEQMTAEWAAHAEELADSPNDMEKRQSTFFAMITSEHREMFGESARSVDSIATFGDLPLVVIASGIPNPAFGQVAEEFQTFWANQSRALSRKSSQGKFIWAKESSHYIYEDAPDLVTGTILDMVRHQRDK